MTLVQGATADIDASPSGRSRRAWTARRLAQIALIALPLLVLGVQAWRHRYIVDDGFIYLRIISNVLDGDGPVFNPGERVELYTGVLWMLLLSAAGALSPLPLEWLAVVLGLGLTLGGLGAGMWGAWRLLGRVEGRGGGVLLVPVGAAVLAVLQPMWNFATTGLETGLTFGWLGVSYATVAWWATRPEESRLPVWALVVLGLGPLVRPELAITSGLLLLVVIVCDWQARGWRGAARVLTWALAAPVAYQLFRMGYFGEIVANTAIAKEGTMPRPGLGWRYLLDFVRPYWLIVPVVLLVLGAYLPAVLSLRSSRRRLAALLVLPVSGVVNAAFVVLMGGDYLHARLLLPALVADVIPVALLPATRRYAVSMLVLPWAVVAAVWLRPPSTLFPFDDVAGDGTVTPAQFGYLPGTDRTSWLTDDALYFKSNFATSPHLVDAVVQPEVRLPTLVEGGIGLDAYYFGDELYIFDLNGLATPLASHMELTRRGHTGHEKSLPTPWVFASLLAPGQPLPAVTDLIQQERAASSGIYGPLIPYATGEELAEQTRLARAALACPQLADFVAAPQRALTPAVVWQNITGSYERTRLRIPPDPRLAYDKFCRD